MKQRHKDQPAEHLIRDYKELFSRRCPDSPDYAEVTLSLITGQLPSVRKLRFNIDDNLYDLRVHTIVIQPSGTMKGPGMNFVSALCKKLGLLYQPLASLNDNALFGAIKRSKEYQASTKSRTSVDAIDPGLLHPDMGINILAMGEASVLYRTHASSYIENSVEFLNTAMNTIGTTDNILSRKVGIGPENNFNSQISMFLAMSREINVSSPIVSKGFYQRMIPLVNNYTRQQRRELSHKADDGFLSDEKPKSSVKLITDLLTEVNKFANNIVGFTIDNDSRKSLHVITDKIYDRFSHTTGRTADRLEEFATYINVYSYRLAMHHSLWSLRDTITLEDIDYSQSILLPIWSRFVGHVEETVIAKPTMQLKYEKERGVIEAFRNISRKYPDDEGAPRKEVIDELMSAWSRAYDTCNYAVKGLEDRSVFRRVHGHGPNSPWIILIKEPDIPDVSKKVLTN